MDMYKTQYLLALFAHNKIKREKVYVGNFRKTTWGDHALN